MSGVYIPGMKMPTNCYDCDFAYQDQDSEHNVYWTCAAVHKSACVHERRDDCPLVPVPKHSALVDSNRLIEIGLHLMHTAKNDDIANGVKWLWQYIIEAPTIIPADKDGDT